MTGVPTASFVVLRAGGRRSQLHDAGPGRDGRKWTWLIHGRYGLFACNTTITCRRSGPCAQLCPASLHEIARAAGGAAGVGVGVGGAEAVGGQGQGWVGGGAETVGWAHDGRGGGSGGRG